jgi:hypothetical protein
VRLCCLLVLLSLLGFTQSFTPATLAGAIYDSSGNPIPGARINVTQSGAANVAHVVSDENGRYTIGGLAPGSYRVEVESVLAPGTTGDVNVAAGERAELILRLAPVPPPVPPLRPESQALRNAEIESGQPGGFIEGYGVYGARGNQGFDFAGLRSQENNFLVDGLDNNEIWTRAPALLPPSDSIAEVEVTGGYMPAGFGHATAATMSIGTRSGSNQFHGTAFDYFENSTLNARNFFDGPDKPGAVSNQFGASLGGPIRRGWFFFINAESLRDRQGMTVISTVPTVAEKGGNFGTTSIYNPLTLFTPDGVVYQRQPFAGNQIPPSQIPASSQAVLALYPNPNLPGAADNYLFTPSAVSNNNQFLGRSDANLTSNNTLFLRFNVDRPEQVLPGALPSGGSDPAQNAMDEATHTRSWSAAASDTHVFRPSLINELRAGASSVNLTAVANDQGVNASSLLGIPGLTTSGLPSIQPTGYASLGAYGPAPLQLTTLSAQIEDNVTWITRRHTFQFGFQAIRRHADGTASAESDRGTFVFTPDFTSQPGVPSGNSIASLLLGYPDEDSRDVQLSPYQIRDWEWSGFVQDQIRLGRRLTIQAGLRYSFYPPVTEANDHLVNFNFSRAIPELDQFARQAGVNGSAGLRASSLAFAPRIGFAYDLTGSGNTVLRGGFSKNYDSGAYMTQAALARNAPYASRYDLINGEFAVGSTLAEGLPAPAAIVPTTANLNATATPVYGIQPATPDTPYADVWNLFVEHRLRPRLVLQAGITGSMGIHLYGAYNANQPEPAPYPFSAPRGPYSPYEWRVDYLGFGGGSTYYGGVTKLAGEVWRGLVVQMSYSFSKSIDDSAAPGTFPEGRPADPQDPFDARANRSLSTFDVQQRAVLAAQYVVPFHQRVLAGWRINALFTLQSGLPFSPELATSTLNDGGYQLPNRVANGALPSGQRSYQHWFDTALDGPGAAFAIPALYQFGDSGLDILRGPGLATADLSLARTFAVLERLKLDIRVDEFNLLNRANFGLPNRILGVDNAGMISYTATPARQSQVSLRLQW